MPLDDIALLRRSFDVARRALENGTDPSDYDHLSRFGEWDMTDDPAPEDLS